jgi:hypothetical protein
MKKILTVFVSCTLILFVKIIINRQSFYIKPYKEEKSCEEIIKKKNIEQFYFNNTLTWFIPSTFEIIKNPFKDHINGVNISYLKLINDQIFKNIDDKIIIFCHGNSYNITWKTKILDTLSDNFNYPIICQDYLRVENPSINSMIENTSNLIKYLNKKGYNNDSIILFGESIGCSIILNVAKKYNIKNVICYVGFRKMSNIVKKILPYFGNIISLFIYELNNEEIIKSTNLNITLLNSPDDKLVDYNDIQDMIKDTNIELLEISGSHKRPVISDNVFLRLKEKYNI